MIHLLLAAINSGQECPANDTGHGSSLLIVVTIVIVTMLSVVVRLLFVRLPLVLLWRIVQPFHGHHVIDLIVVHERPAEGLDKAIELLWCVG